MMRAMLIVGCVLMLVAALATGTRAACDPDWSIQLKVATNEAGTAAVYTSGFRTRPIYSDAKAAEDTLAPPPGAAPIVYAYSTIGADNLINDFRGSLTGIAEVWNIKLASANFAEGAAPTSVYLFGWNPANTSIVTYNDFAPLTGERILLYAAPGGVRGQLLWTVDPSVNGTGAHGNAGTWESGPVAMGSQYQLVVGVPEPDSMLAMLSGLVGLAGFAIRRKR